MPPAYVKPYVKRQKNDAAHLLFDEARILDGERPADARMFCDRLERVLRRGLGKISA
jgi:molecular chaperone HtpG